MLGQRLKLILKEKNITQLQLAQELGLTQQAINRWCQNITEPDIDTIIKIAKTLNISTDFLLGNDEKISDFEKDIKEREILKKFLVKSNYMKEEEELNTNDLKRLLKFISQNKDFIKEK